MSPSPPRIQIERLSLRELCADDAPQPRTSAERLDPLGLERVVGITSPANAASIRVLEKLGLRYRERVQLSADDSGTALRV